MGFNLGHKTTLDNIVSKTIAHGSIQGTVAAAQGGKFEHGFLAGSFGELGISGGEVLGGNTGAAIGGIVAGGTAAELGGGKFANGALSAAFVAEYNQPILIGLLVRATIKGAQSIFRLGVRQLRSKSASKMAKELAGRINRNSVKGSSTKSKVRIDLRGRGHFDKHLGREVPTPHVQTQSLHVGPNGHINTGVETIRSATRSDIRLARELARRQGLID